MQPASIFQEKYAGRVEDKMEKEAGCYLGRLPLDIARRPTYPVVFRPQTDYVGIVERALDGDVVLSVLIFYDIPLRKINQTAN